ncbi:small ribosomal subunit protein mS23 isoform X1 [Ascaphus truei]|uniref:small ribosomal subunit protein mS23 isoform X1 n=2 Tax=Ascaphus truei TaxID=8439 RepID=UPI003F59313A
MAGSRLEKLGTVFTRVRDLLRAGVMKPDQKPVWFDIYAAFPPKREPLYEKPAKRILNPPDNVPVILYTEDVIRAKFYEAYGSGPRVFDLSRTNFKSTSQRFVEKFSELQKVGEVDEQNLFEETGKALLAEGIILRRKGVPVVRQQPPPEPENRDPLLKNNLKNIFEEMQEQKSS